MESNSIQKAKKLKGILRHKESAVLLHNNTQLITTPNKQQLDSSSSSKHFTWDEDNLAQNKEIQIEFSAKKIDEPKTPYVAYVLPDDPEESTKQESFHENDELMTNGNGNYFIFLIC